MLDSKFVQSCSPDDPLPIRGMVRVRCSHMSSLMPVLFFLTHSWTKHSCTCARTQLTDISMTQDMEATKRNIIIYDMQTGTKFILRAQNMSTRNSWLEKSNQLIRKAKIEAARTLTVRTPPTEPRRRQRPRSAGPRVLQSLLPLEEVR